MAFTISICHRPTRQRRLCCKRHFYRRKGRYITSMRVAPSFVPSVGQFVPLAEGDVSDAFALSSIAGWNQTPDDWRLLLELADACCGIRVDGKIVATATLVCFGQTVAWIGMVLTHPEFRRRGLARSLVARMMEQAEMLGVRTLKLDATDDGRRLYESFGFRPEQGVERWQRVGQSVPAVKSGNVAANALRRDLDAEACGYDRGRLLMRLAAGGDAVTGSDGHALSRPGRLNRYLGPCVAVSQTTARAVIEETIARHPDTGWFWDLLPANESAAALAREFGFERVRELTRMSWGCELSGKEERVFAIAGLELG
jgi:GNAT superfamily N-acetyltransferase